MISESRDAAAVRVFPPGIPLGAILPGVALDWLWPIQPGFAVPRPERYWLGGLIVVGALLGLGLWSVVLFRRGGQDENPWRPTPHIEERGPFRITRNPMYLQMVLVCIGLFVLLMNWWILALTPVVAWFLQRLAILPEEAYLERKFGEAYLSYKRRVRRWLQAGAWIPRTLAHEERQLTTQSSHRPISRRVPTAGLSVSALRDLAESPVRRAEAP